MSVAKAGRRRRKREIPLERCKRVKINGRPQSREPGDLRKQNRNRLPRGKSGHHKDEERFQSLKGSKGNCMEEDQDPPRPQRGSKAFQGVTEKERERLAGQPSEPRGKKIDPW